MSDGVLTSPILHPAAPAQDGREARAKAVLQQAQASDPAVSAFVEASAGSGKTKLLTDRMLRLMLGGAAPGRLQCLTFTKAAAAEMALRLQHRLGMWATMDDAPLDAQLRALEVVPDEARRTAARRLFATVLDLPGGMRIGTIHAFCQGLLRRFPLEASISPHFQLVEEAEAEAEMQAAREDVLAASDPASVAAVAGLVRADDFSRLVHALQGQRARLAPLMALDEAGREAAVWRAARATAATDAEAVAEGVSWAGEDALQAALARIQAEGSTTVRERALSMLEWLSVSAAQRAVRWDEWLLEFTDKGGKPRSWGTFPNLKLHQAHPDIRAVIEAEQARVLAVEDTRRAIRCAEATCALLRLAAPALEAYAAAKERGGLLDYTDLIGRTERLLEDPGALWVLYKLDGGIDHLLLDEVQDTAPEQWRIAHRLTEEFFAGQGAKTEKRTFFAVGDPKQSIYSFQGADPAEFTRSRAQMADRVGLSGQVWRDVALDVSFRSTAPVLGLVDAVFQDPVARVGVADGAALRHDADRAGHAGRVELWPLAPAPDQVPPAPWTVPPDNLGLVSAPQRLADGIAASIAAMLARGDRLESQDRLLTAGDILVLVRARGAFATALVRALKARGVAVAGMDRLKLTEQVAVQDLVAACEAVLLPQDCLAVACVLTSPLGGLTDESLMALASGRKGRLWDTLRDRAAERPDWAAAWRFLSQLAARADFVSPHALLVEALGVLGGRARLLARLGAEAAEPIDELLNAALTFTRVHPPSLQGFLHWLRQSGAEVKREAGGAGAALRVMTAHGAKGLQAPLVILPDTVGLPPNRETLAWCEDEDVAVPLWSPRTELRCDAWRTAAAAARALQMREYNRLLYVALTRAEDRLIVCGWQTRASSVPDDCWYAMVERGFGLLEAVAAPFEDAGWTGEMLVHDTPQRDTPAYRPAAAATLQSALPPWAGRPGHWVPAAAPEEPALPRPLAPSRPSGAMFGPVPAATSPLVMVAEGRLQGRTQGQMPGRGARFARGVAVHELLQHLPSVAARDRAAAAAAYLARTGLDAPTQADLADQVMAVLDHAELAPLWGPGSRAEQPLSGLVSGVAVSGVVDRMVVLPDRVLLADFKTGRAAPAAGAALPVRYLRQLAAYRAVLLGLFPGRPILCALVWTEGAVVTPIPDALLDRHAPGRPAD